MNKSILMIVEAVLILITLTLAVLWIQEPSKNYEPYTIICGCLIGLVEVLRRRIATDEHQEPAIDLPERSEVIDPIAIELLELIESEEDIDIRGIVEICVENQPGMTAFFTKLQYSGGPAAMKSRLFRNGIDELIQRKRLYAGEYSDSTNTITYEYQPEE
jgi:hypothetical protein